MNNNSPGKVEIIRAEIYNSTKTNAFSIKKNLIAVDIFEDIYTPFVYCDLTVVDFNKIASKLPFVGEEFFVISFKTPNGKQVTYEFYLFNQDDGAIAGNLASMQVYVMRGMTLERAFDAAKTVSRSYKGTYAAIAGQIFDDYIKKDTNLEFQYEASKSVARYIVPQLSPLQAIEYCRSKAVPNASVYSPFTFFRNSNGYQFISLNSLFNKAGSSAEKDPAIHVLSNPSPDPTISDVYEEGGNIIKTDLKSFTAESRHDSLTKVEGGAYNNQSFSFDLTTKQFVLRKDFNLYENLSKFQLGAGSKNNTNTDKFLRTFKSSRAYVIYKPVDFSIELEGTQTNFHPDAVGEMMAYSVMLAQQQSAIVMYGDSNITAGQAISIRIYEPTDQNVNKKVDTQLSGNYIATRVRHNITFDTETLYELHITGIKGTNLETIEELQADE